MRDQLVLTEDQMEVLRELGITEEPKLNKGFTVTELINLLPKTIENDYGEFKPEIDLGDKEKVEVGYYQIEGNDKFCEVCFKSSNLLVALFHLLVWCKNN